MMQKGFQNLVWFMGVVEQNDDPQALGRVKVRVFGFHPEDKTQVPTEDLPWAFIINGSYNAAYKPPAVNKWVFGFFLDGENAQHPMLVGTMLGMPTQAPSTDTSDGFNSANHSDIGQTAIGAQGANPACEMFQPDMSRLARREELTSTNVLGKNMTGGQPAAGAKEELSWQTPKSAYNAQYPHNWVHETESGHVFELDDTAGSERVHLAHASLTSIEMDSNGTLVIYAKGDGYITIDRSGFIKIAGDQNVTVGRDCNVQVDGNVNMTVNGDYNLKVHGSYNLDVAQQMNVNVANTIKMRGSEIINQANQGRIDLDAKGAIQLLSGSDMTFETLTDQHIKIGGSKYEDIVVNSNLKIGDSSFNNVTNTFNLKTTDTILNSGSITNIKASGNIVQTGAEIHLNGPTAATATDSSDVIVANIELGKTNFPPPPEIRVASEKPIISYPVSGASPSDDSADPATAGPQ